MLLIGLIVGSCLGYGLACFMFGAGEEDRIEAYHEEFKKFYGISSENQTERCITSNDKV